MPFRACANISLTYLVDEINYCSSVGNNVLTTYCVTTTHACTSTHHIHNLYTCNYTKPVVNYDSYVICMKQTYQSLLWPKFSRALALK